MQSMQRTIAHKIFPFALIAVAVIVAYANSIRGGFISDDWPMVVENKQMTSFKHLPEFFAHGVWANSSLNMQDSYFYRPFYLVYLFLNYQAWGDRPAGFHIISIAIHLINCLMVYEIIRRMLRQESVFPALTGALIFAVHPVHTESVSWISGGAPDLLFTAFFLFAFFSYLQFREQRRQRHLVFMIASYVISLLCKESAVLFPFVIAGYELIEDGKIDLRRFGVLLAVLSVYFGIRHLSIGKVAGALVFSMDGLLRLGEFVSAYIKMLFVPWPLAYFFEAPAHGIVSAVWILFSIAAGCAVIFYAIRDKHARFGVLWLVLTLAPPLALSFNAIPKFASRYLYLPSVGFVIVASAAAAAAMRTTKGKTALLIAVTAGIALFVLLTIRQNTIWQNDEVFYTNVVRQNPANGYLGLGLFYERTGQADHAIVALKQALYLAPENDDARKKDKSVISEKIAMLYGKSHVVEDSIAYFRNALALNPRSTSAYLGLGNDYYLKREYDKALENYTAALSLDARNVEALYNVAQIHEIRGRRTQALAAYRRFCELASSPEYADLIGQVRLKIQLLESIP